MRQKSLAAAELPLQQKRALAMQIHGEHGVPVRTACEVLGLARSTYYRRPQRRDERALRAAITTEAGQWPTYGSRRITHQLRRVPYGLVVNRKRVQRLMHALNLQARRPRRTWTTTNSQHGHPRYPNLVCQLTVDRPDQVWVADITYVSLPADAVYLAIIMDVFTRAIRGWDLRRTLDQQLTLGALDDALDDHVPDIHHSTSPIQCRTVCQAADHTRRAHQHVRYRTAHSERLCRTSHAQHQGG